MLRNLNLVFFFKENCKTKKIMQFSQENYETLKKIKKSFLLDIIATWNTIKKGKKISVPERVLGAFQLFDPKTCLWIENELFFFFWVFFPLKVLKGTEAKSITWDSKFFLVNKSLKSVVYFRN